MPSRSAPPPAPVVLLSSVSLVGGQPPQEVLHWEHVSAKILDLRHDIFGGGVFAPPHLPTLGSQCCQLNPSSLHTFARIVLNIRGAQVHCYHPVVYWNSSWTASSKPSVSSETTNATNASFLLFMCVGPCVSAKGPDVVILLQQALLTYNQSLGVMSVMTKVLRVATVPLVTRTGVTRPRCIFSHSKGRLASTPGSVLPQTGY